MAATQQIAAILIVFLAGPVCATRVVPVALRAKEATNIKQEASLVVEDAVANQHLRICNAYAGKEPIDIFRLPEEKITEAPLAYKSCRDFEIPLKEADKFKFRAGATDVGVFTATGVPKASASLLLVVNRRGARTKSAGFQSHSFSDLKAAQLAVIDAYGGLKVGASGKSHIEIADAAQEDGKHEASLAQRAEALTFNSVIAVNPGAYSVSLVDGKGKHSKVDEQLDAKSGQTYVLMRVGLAEGDKFSEELVVFGGASALRLHAAAALAVTLLCLAGRF